MKFWKFGSSKDIQAPLPPNNNPLRTSQSQQTKLAKKYVVGLGVKKLWNPRGNDTAVLAAIKALLLIGVVASVKTITKKLITDGTSYHGTKYKTWYEGAVSHSLGLWVAKGIVKSRRTHGSEFVYWLNGSVDETQIPVKPIIRPPRIRTGFMDCGFCNKHLKGDVGDLKRHQFGAHGEEEINRINSEGKKQSGLIQEVNEEHLKILSKYLTDIIIDEMEKRGFGNKSN